MELSKDERRRLVVEAQKLEPQAQVGKQGVTPGTVEEVARQLEDHRLVKVRILRSALEEQDAKALAATLAEQCGATLVEVRGHTAVLWRPGKRKRVEKETGGRGGAPAKP